MTIDILASSYGWTKEYIETKIYPDDLGYLTKYIRQRTYGNYLMEAYIAQNPHVKKPKPLIDILRKNAGEVDQEETEVLDKAGFQRFKRQLKKESKFIEVK